MEDICILHAAQRTMEASQRSRQRGRKKQDLPSQPQVLEEGRSRASRLLWAIGLLGGLRAASAMHSTCIRHPGLPYMRLPSPALPARTDRNQNRRIADAIQNATVSCRGPTQVHKPNSCKLLYHKETRYVLPQRGTTKRGDIRIPFPSGEDSSSPAGYTHSLQ